VIVGSLLVTVLEFGLKLKLELELHVKEGQCKVHYPEGNVIFPSITRQPRYYAILLAGVDVD
jgi:hypothetical protein